MKMRILFCVLASVGIAICSVTGQSLPEPVKGVPVLKNAVAPPEIMPLRGELVEFDAYPNVHPVGLTTTRQLPANLKVVTLGKDGVPGPRTIPAQFKKIPVRYPRPEVIEDPSVQRDAMYTIKNLSEDEGFNANTITGLLEDSRGHIWISSLYGTICRHDGERLTCFSNENGFPLTWGVRRMLEDRHGRIWFASDGGVCFYDGHNFWHFEREGAQDWDAVAGGLLEDRHGNIWFAYGDIYRFSEDEFTIYDEDTFLSAGGLLEDRHGHIWMTTEGKGVLRFDGRQVVYITEENGLIDNRIEQMEETSEGELWFGSGGWGVGDAKGLSRFIPDAESTALPTGTMINYTAESGLSGTRITAIEEDKYGRVWFSTFKNGLMRFDAGVPNGPGDQFVHFGGIEGINPDQLSLLVGRNNVIWAGTNGGGLNQIVLSGPTSLATDQSLIRDMRITAFEEDGIGNIWLSPDYEGLVKFDGEKFRLITTQNGIPPDWIQTIETDTMGNLWIGTRDNGILKFDGKQFSRYSVDQGLARPQVQTVLLDQDGMIWVSCFQIEVRKRAVMRLNPVTSEMIKYEGVGNNADIGATGIFQDRDGVLWFGGHRAVAVYNAEKDQLEYVAKFEKPIDQPMWGGWMAYFVEDHHGNIWVAMTDVNHTTVKLIQLKADGQILNGNFPTMEKGVHWPDVSVNYMTTDTNGNIWFASESGVFGSRDGLRIMAAGDANWVKLTKDDGLKGNRTRMLHVDAQNRLWMDHQTKGMSVLDLEAFEFPDQAPPGIGIIDIEVGGGHVDFQSILRDTLTDPVHPLAQAYDSLLPFSSLPVSPSLPHDQNHLTFHFSAPDWSALHTIEFSYMLEGLEDNWSPASPESKADYREIPHGSYTFKVRAKGAGNMWSQPAEYEFRILPPWWLTPWAYVLYTLIVVGSVGGYIMRLQRRVKKKQEQLEYEQYLNRELRDLNIATTRFVPQDFVKMLDKESLKELKLGDQIDATMTVLFSDIRDYTQLSEGMTPEQNFRFINAYVGRMGPIIKEYGGFICQYYGDGIMALFKENHHKAIQAAVAMHKALDQYNQQRFAVGRKPVSIGIGLNTGHLMLGVIGDQHRYDTSVISDAVNTASRLEGLTKIFGSQIIVSEKTLHEIKNLEHGLSEGQYMDSFRFLGKVKVKGKDRVLKIYEVFDGEAVSLREKKLKTRPEFERAIQYYLDRDFGKAGEILKGIVEQSPDDVAARYYMNRTIYFIVNGVEDNWSGVEEIVGK